MNPLFPSDNSDKPPKNLGFLLPRAKGQHIKPPSAKSQSDPKEDKNAAVALIRRKLDTLYAIEPDAKKELTESKQIFTAPRSKHQQFMYELSTSGKSLAQIQTEWHNYYVSLPDNEKHAVWREFYDANNRSPSHYTRHLEQSEATEKHTEHPPKHKVVVAEHTPLPTHKPGTAARTRGVAKVRKHILQTVQASSQSQAKAKQHLQSLIFGVATGVIVLLIFLFGFFNEMVIAPFIQPSRQVNATPIILGNDGVAPSETPEVIIPKINVQIPIVLDEKSVDEAAIQRALERGVIHYPSTVLPGQQGNTAVFGHSSNNIFNKGKYKFAFVLLQELVPGDIFYLTNGGKVYSYRVYDKKIVRPDETSVLNAVSGKTATATLITCDPPGTSINRLVVWGEQVSPDPAGAAAPTTPSAAGTTQLPSEGPTLFGRFIDWLF